jgi:hypothetical protein
MQLPAKEVRSLSLGEVFRFEVNATGGRARPTGMEKKCVRGLMSQAESHSFSQGNNPQRVWYIPVFDENTFISTVATARP